MTRYFLTIGGFVRIRLGIKYGQDAGHDRFAVAVVISGFTNTERTVIEASTAMPGFLSKLDEARGDRG